MTEVASSKCQLCGLAEPHEHSGVERAIFRNGQKSALAMLNKPVAYWAPVADMVITAVRKENDGRIHDAGMFYVPLYETPTLPPSAEVKP